MQFSDRRMSKPETSMGVFLEKMPLSMQPARASESEGVR
jgi:hypothetical protein